MHAEEKTQTGQCVLIVRQQFISVKNLCIYVSELRRDKYMYSLIHSCFKFELLVGFDTRLLSGGPKLHIRFNTNQSCFTVHIKLCKKTSTKKTKTKQKAAHQRA